MGRDPARLRAAAAEVGGATRTVVADSVDAMAGEVSRGTPAVVVNLVGPFTDTGVPIARACPPGTHYVDLANELFAVTDLLGLADEAAAAGKTLVTGAGFGVLATESVVLELCADRPAPHRVRVDALAAVDAEPGPVGASLAGSLVDGFGVGGRRYANGQLVRARLSGDVERLTLPDGSTVQVAAGAPTGDLEAAHRASGAPFVVAGSGYLPTGRAVRAVLPAVTASLSIPALRDVAKRRLARVRVAPRPRTREFSWAHARVEERDGTVRTGWLRAGEGMAFTVAVAAEVVDRLSRDESKPGAYTPGALFGPELAESAGGRFIVD
ncbi:saccharopine dehydrogenase NADP-binding domain-containing protein [Kibdelosporangium lantanae]